MHTVTLSEIKKELHTIPQEQLLEYCIRIARYKKENKELLQYLLFESSEEENYILNIKEEMDDLFSNIQVRHLYIAKKGIRKVLRLVNKYIRYSGKHTTAIELLMHFCKLLDNLEIDYRTSTALANLRESQFKKINKAIETLHEDLQYDYRKDLATILNARD